MGEDSVVEPALPSGTSGDAGEAEGRMKTPQLMPELSMC